MENLKEKLKLAKEDIIKKQMFPEEKQQIEEEIKLEIEEIISSFENQDEEEIIDE